MELSLRLQLRQSIHQRPPILPMPLRLTLCWYGQLTLSLSLHVPRMRGQGKACGWLWGTLVRCVPAGWLYDIPWDLRQRAA